MTSDIAATRTKHWTIDLDILEQGDDTTVHAVLRGDAGTLESHTVAQRNPHDAPNPEIGDDFAAGRALLDLGRQLLRAGTVDSSAAGERPGGW
ncbi:dsRBD fold-containing protein [Streptacidiphilus sp. EB103A]|uniref:dsRBD fold-containing protein n=1 Tax=Streptacidiphilus sp. EB103A TaxID=3156275 RepID=UPI003515EA60